MKKSDPLVIDRLKLRRNLYFLTSLLLADQRIAEIKDVSVWTRDIHEAEARDLIMWTALAARSLLNLSDQRFLGQQVCGEYWADFTKVKKEQLLDFRQACNSAIHAEEIFLYRVLSGNMSKTARETDVYTDRITIDGTHRNKMTRAQIDIIQFVRIGNTVINFYEEENHANHQKHL